MQAHMHASRYDFLKTYIREDAQTCTMTTRCPQRHTPTCKTVEFRETACNSDSFFKAFSKERFLFQRKDSFFKARQIKTTLLTAKTVQACNAVLYSAIRRCKLAALQSFFEQNNCVSHTTRGCILYPIAIRMDLVNIRNQSEMLPNVFVARPFFLRVQD